MEDPEVSKVNLEPIFTKLGHEVEEIRVRALKNLLSKLEHRLVLESDLVQEHHLLIRLLEWFNFKDCPLKDDVLVLIQRLAKHHSAAEEFVRIGAVRFLSQLRYDLEEMLQSCVDSILEILLTLPGEVVTTTPHEHCFYDVQPNMQPNEPRVGGNTIPDMVSPNTPNGYFPASATSPSPLAWGKVRRALDQDKSPGSEGICGVTFSTFPWLPLTTTDVHVLTSTNNSLCSSQVQVVKTSCDFINDVVLHDFPAEIFLQRPSIIKSLLTLLSNHRQATADDPNQVTQHAVQCLVNISTLLIARFQFYHDPALYCPKQEFLSQTNSSTSSLGGEQSHSTIQSTLSSDSRPSIIGRTNRRVSGDGRDWDSHSSMGSSPLLPDPASPPPRADPETDSEDTIVLQFSQTTLPQFALDAMQQVLGLMKAASPGRQLTTHLVRLLHRTLSLMSVAMTADIWQDSSVSGRLLTDKLSDCLEALGCLILHHLQAAHADHVTSQQREYSINVYQVLASFALNVISHFIPVAKAKDLLPEELSSALSLLLLDAGFAVASPECIGQVEAYSRSLSPEQTNLYQDLQQVAGSMQSACDLVRGKNTLTLQEKLELAEAAILSCPFHGMGDVIDTLVQVCSEMCKARSDTIASDDVDACRQTLLQYLAHPDLRCRLHTYTACLKTAKNSLRVKEVMLPGSEVSHNVAFLLAPSVLHEVTCYGLDDSNSEIQQLCEGLLVHLLQARLLMTLDLWDQMLQSLIPIMPLLQSQASSHPAVSQCANSLIHKCLDPAVFGSYSRLPGVEQIRGALRLMFSKDVRLRTEATSTLMWHLIHEPEADLKRPTLTPAPRGLEDLFVFHARPNLDAHNEASVFQEDGLLQVLNIFTSENTERDLKKSALQQMAIILQDSRLHHAFVSNGGLDRMMDTLATVIIPTSESSATAELLPALVSILRHLVHANGARRRKMGHQSGLYLMLLRASLISRPSEEARQEIAHLLTLLLFDEVITMATDEGDGSRRVGMPKAVIQAFQLPFRCSISPSARSHRLTARPSPDPLRQPETWTRLKVEWIRSWSTGTDSLEYVLQHGDSRNIPASHNLDLKLLPEETALLAASYPPTALDQSLQTIHAATSHFTVKQTIWQLSLMIQWASLLKSGGDDVLGGMTQLKRGLLNFDWKACLNRFLEITPANAEDEHLLAHVLSLLSQLLRSRDLATPDLVEWVGSSCVGSGKLSLVELLAKYPPAGQVGDGQEGSGGGGGGGGRKGREGSQGLVRKEVLRLLTVYVQNLPMSQDAWRRKGMFLGGSLVHGLLGSLDLADALHFYDLPSLESTLHCLVHVTARPGWSLDWAEGDSLTLCQQMLTSLQEVVSAFHVGRGGTAMSYMGKGVTKSATLCLLHLTREVAARAVDKSWPLDWLYTSKGSSEAGFTWLTPLLSYRDPEVRAAGLGIAASLASCGEGCAAVASCFQQRTGGVWGLGLSVLLDHTECSVVRQQAAAFLANLLLQPFATDDKSKGQKNKDQPSQIGVAGLSAVLALLQYHRFFPEVAVMLTHFYQDCTIQPVSVVEDSTLPSSSTLSGPPTLTTPDSSDVDDVVGSRSNVARRIITSQAERDRTGAEMRSPEGQSVTSSQDTISASSSTPRGGRYESVVTPGLVTSTASLLTNLLSIAPRDTIQAITKENILHTFRGIINVHCLQTLLQATQTLPTGSSLESPGPASSPNGPSSSPIGPSSHPAGPASYMGQVQLCRQITMCGAILRLFASCLQHDAPICLEAMHDGKLAAKCCQIVALRLPEQADVRVASRLHELWGRSFEFLSVLCHLSGLQDLSPVLCQNLRNITNCVISIMRNPSPASTRISALSFLSVILTKAEEDVSESSLMPRSLDDGGEELAEGQDGKSVLARLLDEIKGEEEVSMGGELCDVLLKAYDGTLPRSTGPTPTPNPGKEKAVVFSALKTLLAISDAAKSFALHAGLVETSVDSIKQMHTKLTLESLHMDRAGKKKEDPVFAHLISSFDLLNSLMLHSHQVKIAAHQAGLSSSIHKLWAWLSMEERLMSTTLLLLTTLTARCPTVCTAIASCGPGQTGNSILHYLVKLVDRERLKAEKLAKSAILQRTFSVLGNLVWYGECRNVLWKSGFLTTFTKCAVPRSTKQTKTATSSNLFAALWLQLLANLTFATEGQHMVTRIPDGLDLLLDFAQCALPTLQESALLVLHNLCYLAVNKTRMLANDKLVQLFMSSLTSGDLKAQLTVTSALYALIYDSQKAKAVLKPSRLFLTLQELEGALQKELQQPQPPATVKELVKQEMAARCQNVTAYIIALLQD